MLILAAEPTTKVAKRDPNTVMRLSRLGSFHQSRLSFMRVLLRRLKRESWQFDCPTWEIDETGVGRAVYRARGPRKTYCLVAFAHDLPPESRSDRVIATAWDATFCLFDGEPDIGDLDRLQANVPKQEAGRVSDKELSLSRANRSVRLWDHVIDHLAMGKQPDAETVESVGYLMRTTAVYGSGKFGAADRTLIADREMMCGPFQAEMLSVFLTRAFTLDLVEHMARVKGGDHATVIEPTLRRRFGVGNSTGLGMAPFLMNHPVLLNNWISAREEALARVRSVETPSSTEVEQFTDYLARAVINVDNWNSAHEIQIEKISALQNDLNRLTSHVNADGLSAPYPWDSLYQWAEQNLSLEGQEQLVSLMMEPYEEIIDELAQYMDADELSAFPIDGSMPVSAFRQLIEDNYGWTLGLDLDRRDNQSRFWYVSQEKLEPRLGERFDEPGAEYEQPYDISVNASLLHKTLGGYDDDCPLADFLLECPEYRHLARRIQTVATYPYAEIRDNLISAEMLPIDILRCKLSFFGATRFDPRSDRWVRICMFQGAPYPNELESMAGEDWCYPPLEEQTS